MVRRPDRPLQIVRVSFETTRFSAHHLIEAYTVLVPIVRRQPRAARETTMPLKIEAMTTRRRRGEG